MKSFMTGRYLPKKNMGVISLWPGKTTHRAAVGNAAIAPKYLGQVAVIAKDYARIAWQNLINFGILPLEFENQQNYDAIEQGAMIEFKNLREDIMNKGLIRVKVKNKNNTMEILTKHGLSDRQIGLFLKGGVINDFKDKLSS